MPTETIKSIYSNIPKLTENNYPMWKEKVRRVIMGADAYKIMTREGPEPQRNNRDDHAKWRNWHKQRNNAQSIIYRGCSNVILPQIKHTIDPAKMWDILDDRCDTTLSQLVQTQILRKFHVCHPAKHQMMTTYLTRQIDYRNQLSGSAEEISEDSIVTHPVTPIPKESATTVNIFKRHPPDPTSQHILDAI